MAVSRLRSDGKEVAAAAVDPSVEDQVAAWRLNVEVDSVHIREVREILRSVRQQHLVQCREALRLLEEEQSLRKRRCNQLSREIGKVQDKKVRLLSSCSALLESESRATSQDGSEEGEKPKGIDVLSKGKKQRSAVPPQVGCGSLSKKEVERHFSRYWAEKSKARPSHQM